MSDSEMALSKAAGIALLHMADKGAPLTADSYYDAAQMVLAQLLEMEKHQSVTLEIRIDGDAHTRSNLQVRVSELSTALDAMKEQYPQAARPFCLHVLVQLPIANIARMLNADCEAVLHSCQLGRCFVVRFVRAAREKAAKAG